MKFKYGGDTWEPFLVSFFHSLELKILLAIGELIQQPNRIIIFKFKKNCSKKCHVDFRVLEEVGQHSDVSDILRKEFKLAWAKEDEPLINCYRFLY